MIRVICSLPEGLRLHMLTEAQQAGIAAVYTQYVLPMPGTRPDAGRELVDGLVGDNFDPAAIDQLGLPFTLLAVYEWDGISDELTPIVPLAASALLPYLPDVPVYDGEGNQTGTVPPEPRLPMNWAGWPQITVSQQQ